MNKGEIISNVAEKAGISKKDAEKSVNAILEVITEALQNGEKVQLVGFGTFEVHTRKARVGKNPNTQEDIMIPESQLPVFKAGKNFKEAVAKK